MNRTRTNLTMKNTIKTAAVIASLAMLVAAAPAAAKGKKAKTSGPYSGTTSGGSSITFSVGKGGAVNNVNSSIYLTCTSLQSSVIKGGVELFTPPAGSRFGTTESEALQPSAVAARDVTKHYTTTFAKSGKRVTGQLKLSLSYYVADLYNPRIYMRFGTTDFSAKRR